MKSNRQPAADWQTEVWRIKEELSADARRMGLREYVAFVEREARRILADRRTRRRTQTVRSWVSFFGISLLDHQRPSE